MSVIRPFAGLRPPQEKVLKVACPPYDVVDSEEARAYGKGNPLSFFRISRPEIDLPPGTDAHAPEVYDLGLTNLQLFVKEGHLKADAKPCLYLYKQKMGKHEQVGLVAAASCEEYRKGTIKKHELTRADKEDDRTQHIDRLNGNDEPVFLTYPARKEIDDIVNRLIAAKPEYDFETDDGIRHTFWVVSGDADIAALVREFAKLPATYIADGHHRSAAAARTSEARAARAGKKPTGDAEHDYFLAVIFPHNQMQIMDYNRLVKDLNGRTVEQFKAEIGAKFTMVPSSQKSPSKLHDFGMYLEGAWYMLTAKAGTFDEKDPVKNLDVSILQENLLGPVLGIKDPRTDKRIDFSGGIRGMQELEKRVDAGQAKVAFAMFPTQIDQLMSIADAGQIMPPKSTWFEPKLRSGLVLHGF